MFKPKFVYVSCNCDINDSIKEEKEYADQGYLTIETYWNDFDCGNIMEYAEGENRDTVLKKHLDFINRCNIQRETHMKLGIY